MLDRKRLSAILALALPIIGGMVSQNVLNLVDTLMVGRLGDVALAAVGSASFLQFACTAFVTGISAGVQAIASRRKGEGNESEMAAPLTGGLFIGVVLGVPLTLVLIALSPHLMALVVDDPEVVQVGTPYLQVRLLAVVAVAMNFSYRGFWNGVGLSKVYFRTIVVMHVVNVVLNYLFIFGKFGFPEMGATGAGLASTLSFWLGTLLYTIQAFSLARGWGFLSRMPSRDELRRMLRLAVPTGVQQTFFAAGMTVFFAILSRVGTRELAASNVLVNLLLVVILPSIGFGIASATLVGQSLGAGRIGEARAWGTDVVRVASVIMTSVGFVGALSPGLLLAPFLHDPETLAAARGPLRLIALSLPIDAVGLVLMHSLIGAGLSRRVMVITVGLQWGVQLPLVYLAALVFGQGLTVIWGVHFGYRAIQALALYREWRGEAWTQVAV